MHRNNMRITRLEDFIRQQRDAKIDRIGTFIQYNMTPTEIASFCDALARDIEDGPHAQFTEAEIDAIWRFDQMVASRPDIGRLIAEIGGHYEQTT